MYYSRSGNSATPRREATLSNNIEVFREGFTLTIETVIDRKRLSSTDVQSRSCCLFGSDTPNEEPYLVSQLHYLNILITQRRTRRNYLLSDLLTDWLVGWLKLAYKVTRNRSDKSNATRCSEPFSTDMYFKHGTMISDPCAVTSRISKFLPTLQIRV